MRVAAYLRVSTEDQAREGFSLEAQKTRLEGYCQAQGWKISAYYTEEGKSGRNTSRPAYQKMMADVDTWDVILVVKMDRIHRSSKHFMAMMEDLEGLGKKFASVTEAFDTTTAMGRFVMDIIQRIAQLESETIGERVFMGMEQKAKSGSGSLGGPTPFGYLRDERGNIVLDYEKSGLVRKLFFTACGAGSISEAGELVGLDRFQARRILRNPVYAGCMAWDGILQAGTHPAIVSKEKFMAVQERFKTGVVI